MNTTEPPEDKEKKRLLTGRILSGISILIILLTACSALDGSNRMPGVEIQLSKMNKDLHLFAPPEANLFKIGDDFAIVIENLSEDPIIISANEVSVYEKMESEWKKLR